MSSGILNLKSQEVIKYLTNRLSPIIHTLREQDQQDAHFFLKLFILIKLL